jgi:hypothetical protein
MFKKYQGYFQVGEIQYIRIFNVYSPVEIHTSISRFEYTQKPKALYL